MNIQYPKTKQEKKDRLRRAKENRRIIKEAKERAEQVAEERKKAIEKFIPTTMLRKTKSQDDHEDT